MTDPVPDAQLLYADLQTAIELEWATLPPYLYACWSLVDPVGPEARAIRRVIGEEMLHLGMACNLLNALGGEPRFGPDVAPRYPAPAPGNLDDGTLVLRLLPWSIPALDLFIRIEARAPTREEVPRRLHSHLRGGPASISQFYGAIRDALGNVPEDGIKPRRQLVMGKPQSGGKLIAVTALTHAERRAQAEAMIDEIVVQGDATVLEGGPPPTEPSHLERFSELRRVVASHPPDTACLVTDPSLQLHRYSSDQLRLNHAFNSAYSELVDGLSAAFRMEAPNLYASAGPAMLAMERRAAELRRSGPVASGPTDTTEYPGPTFCYVPAYEREA
ncbi:MAG: ferritin-like protein [Myxococcota bacterium]